MQRELDLAVRERKSDIYIQSKKPLKPLCLFRRVRYFMKLAWKYHQIQNTCIYLVHGLNTSADGNRNQSPLKEKVLLMDVLSRWYSMQQRAGWLHQAIATPWKFQGTASNLVSTAIEASNCGSSPGPELGNQNRNKIDMRGPLGNTFQDLEVARRRKIIGLQNTAFHLGSRSNTDREIAIVLEGWLYIVLGSVGSACSVNHRRQVI